MADALTPVQVAQATHNSVPPQTAEAINRPQTGSTTLTPAVAPKPAAPVSQATLQQQVNKAQAARAPVPAGLIVASTKTIISPWLRGCIYGETDSWKSTTAAKFGSPEDVRIILTREESQLLPLRDYGYQYAHCKNYSRFQYAMLYPEQLFGAEWAARSNRVVIVDDITRAKEFIVEANETNEEGKELRDNRMVHREAKADMSQMVMSLQSKPLHIVFIALAKIYENKFTHKETVSPDLPPAMLGMLTADWDFIFYSDKERKLLLTGNRVETYQAKNEKGKVESYTRTVFAKHKLPRDLEGKGVLQEYEKHDLQSLWARIQTAKGAA